MRVQTAIRKILASDKPISLKLLKLETLVLRCFPSSPDQKEARAAYETLKAANPDVILYRGK